MFTCTYPMLLYYSTYSRACGADERATAGALVGASVAALMTFTPAFAGVTLEQPKLKNVCISPVNAVSGCLCLSRAYSCVA